MADTTNGPKQLNPNAEPPMKNLFVAFLLMGAVLILSPYFFKSVQPAKPAKPAKPAAQAAQQQPQVAPAAQPVQALPAGSVSASKDELFTIETSLYKVVLSNRGGVVHSWVLKKYKDHTGKPLELVNTAATPKIGYPFALTFADKKPAVDVNQMLYAATPTPDGFGIDYDYSNGTVAVHKSFRFVRNSYLSEVSSRVTQGGATLPGLISWRGGFGDTTVDKANTQQRTINFDTATGKLATNDYKAAKDGPLSAWGAYSFAGIEDSYFAAIFLPKEPHKFQIRTRSDYVASPLNKAEEPHPGSEIGNGGDNRFALFVGPKSVDLLRSVDPRLEQIVDFGEWLGILAKPLFVILNWTNDNVVHNYGWAIVLVTIFINTALLPMRLSSMKQMRRMQDLKPQIDVINAKYKNIKLNDPRKQDQNAEVMDLYKKHGVNPMGGCLPMVIQLPFFFAFYRVLSVSIEMRSATWLWVTDLSRPEDLAIRILPIAMIIAQFVQQKMTPNPSGDPSQQRVMMLMPLIFGFMFYGVSSGLVLYWLTSNLVGIAQQWFINRSMPASPSGPVAKAIKSGSKR